MASNADWVRIYNRLFEVINQPGLTYFSGPRFLAKVREVDPYFPTYSQYLEQRRASGQSTSRHDYFYDILRDLDEPLRLQVLQRTIDEIEQHVPEKARELLALLGGAVPGPAAEIRADAWNADRLNRALAEIDDSISTGRYERAISLAYLCLEGFYKAFVRQRIPEARDLTEILELSRAIKQFVAGADKDFPGELLNMIGHVSHAVDRARNRFSEAHFDGEAARWLAVYVRDLVNTQIRLLLHFYGD